MKLRVLCAALCVAHLLPPNATLRKVAVAEHVNATSPVVAKPTVARPSSPAGNGTLAQLTGLKTHAELNGRTVEVVGHTAAGLAIVQLPGGKAFQVAAAHLTAGATAPLGLGLVQGAQPGPPEAQTAVLVGMTKDQSLNGQRVEVLGLDTKSGRYVVQLHDGSKRKVKEEHLQDDPGEAGQPQKEEAVLMGLHDTSLNGLHVEVQGFDKASGRYVVKLPDGRVKKVVESHLEQVEKPGGAEMARLVGMKSDASLNGQVVEVLDFDKASGRYVVQLKDGSKRKVKEEHMQPVANDGAPEEAVLEGLKDTSLNGVHVQVLGQDKTSGRYVVKLPDGSERKVTEEHLSTKESTAEPAGHVAHLVGMVNAKELNGQEVHVMGVDSKSGRFVVKLGSGKMVKITGDHLQDVAVPSVPPGESVPALLAHPGHNDTTVEVLGFDAKSGEFVVTSNGSEALEPLESLRGLTNATAERIAEMAVAGKRAPTLPQLTLCNAYQSHDGVTVVLRQSPNKSDDLLITENMPFASCVDLEYPAARGNLLFLQKKMQLGQYPFLVSGVDSREVLVVHRESVNTLAAAVVRAQVPARPTHGQVVLFNTATAIPFVGATATMGGSKHTLAFNKLYDLNSGRYAFDVSADGSTFNSNLDIKTGHTYVLAVTGIGEGLMGEPTPPGFLLHGVDGFDIEEQAPPRPAAPLAAPKVSKSFLQRTAHSRPRGVMSYLRRFLPWVSSTA